MCRIPKVAIVAPRDRHADLRRSLGSLEYDIVATVETLDDDLKADVAILCDATPEAVERARSLGIKTVAVGDGTVEADMILDGASIADFKTRFWELFRPA